MFFYQKNGSDDVDEDKDKEQKEYYIKKFPVLTKNVKFPKFSFVKVK